MRCDTVRYLLLSSSSWSSSSKHGVRPLDEPFWSHTSRNLSNSLSWFLPPFVLWFIYYPWQSIGRHFVYMLQQIASVTFSCQNTWSLEVLNLSLHQGFGISQQLRKPRRWRQKHCRNVGNTWDRSRDSSICIFLFNRTTLQVFVTYLTGALYVHPLCFYRVIRNDCRGFNNLSYTIHLREV